MDSDPTGITELDQRQTKELAQRARKSDYYSHLTKFLTDHFEENIPPENVWAYEIDGTHVVAFTDSSDHDRLPSIGITFEFNQDQITQAVAEVNDLDSTFKQKLIYISELNSKPSEDVLLPNDLSEVADIEEFENVNVYEIREY